MSKDDLRELNIFKTAHRKGKKYAVNGAPYQSLDTLVAFLFKQRNITVSVEVLRELLDEIATDEVVHEKEIQQRLKKMFGGEREVHTPVGFIDLLTDTQLYESKRAAQWKGAIGQLLSYSKFYPDRELVLYLFGDLPGNLKDCYELCKLHKIKLMYEMS
jgi:hypothetical protein